MAARITPLRLQAFDQLPKHARRCVFWEVDPGIVEGSAQLSDPEFEKEAWLSMVMLEWGSCGQLAVESRPTDSRSDTGVDDGVDEDGDDEPCLGYVFYAPPRSVPRAGRFPTAPVSADAVLLTTLGVEAGQDFDTVSQTLITAVVGDLVRRGVRALEAFGRTAMCTELPDRASAPSDVRPVMEALGDCSVEQCVLDADLLMDAGFVVVSHHTYFPRLRLELDKGLGWKAGVEAALERLLESAQLQQPVGAGASPCR